MASPTLPIGQIMPASQSASTLRPSVQSQDPNYLSFQETLNRQQQTAAQLRQMNATVAPPVSVSGSGFNASGRQAAPTPGGIVSAPLPAESLQLLQSMPEQTPEGQKFEQLVLQNMRDYEAMKAQGTATSASAASPLAAGESGLGGALNRALAQAASMPAVPASGNMAQAMATPLMQPVSVGTSSTMTTAMPQLAHASDHAGLLAQGRPVMNARGMTGSMPPQGMSSVVQSRTALTATEPEIDLVLEEATSVKKKRGLFGALGSFFQNVASGVTFGIYRPAGEAAPTGLARAMYPLKKLVVDAPIKDLAIGVPSGIVNDLRSMGQKKPAEESELSRDEQIAMLAEEPAEPAQTKSPRFFPLDYARPSMTMHHRRSA
jgi:hypothetical protein